MIHFDKPIFKELNMKNTYLAYAAATAIILASSAVQAEEKTKVCFIYVGTKTSSGWTQSHELGREELEKALGDRIEAPFVENVPEGPDGEVVIETMVKTGCKLVFSTSFGFMDAMMKVAARYPDVKFEQANGFKVAPNVSTYTSRFYEGRYLSGVIAGKMSKSGIGGYVASFQIPEVMAGINAFELGARSVNPNFKVKVKWAHTWYDPEKEAVAAKELIDEGADVLTHHTDSTAPVKVAEEHGVKAFGEASDMSAAGPNAHLTAILNTWGPYYIKRTNALLDGSWSSRESFDGLKDGILTMAPYSNMPDDVKKLAEETEAKIKSGELKPFTGPVSKQDGSEWLKAGDVADDATILGMDFYVEGIDDKLVE